MNLAGIIFSNLYDERFGSLTAHRTVASLPFGGRYRFVDFVLSNMSNAGIASVGIITKQNYRSLMEHLGACAEWDLHRKGGSVQILAPFSTGIPYVYRGKLEALYSAFAFLLGTPEEYVLLSDSTILCNIPYEEALASHLAGGRDVTVITTPAPVEGAGRYELLLEMTEGEISSVTVDASPTREGTLASMGMYILSKELLLSAVRASVSRGLHLLERDFIQEGFLRGELSLNPYVFRGRVLRNDSVASYFANNLALVDDRALRADLFLTERPIYTKVRDEVPSYYSESTEVADCLLADGCRIDGALSHSVLFRDVVVGRGTRIKNALIMQGAKIGEDCYIENVILDKNVTVGNGVRLVGASLTPYIVEQGERI